MVDSESDSTPPPDLERVAIALVDLQSILKTPDDNYYILTNLFEKLQLAAYEASDMMLDFMTFVDSVRYFSVITRDVYKSYATSNEKSTSTEIPTLKECFERKDIAGMVYLTAPSETRNNTDGVGDLNIGIIIHPQYRRKGYATKAIQLALDHAFKIIHCHRVQAIIINPFSYAKYPSYRFFASTGFKQEGIRRCSYFNVFEGEFQDATYMAMLDTEWLAAQGGIAARASPWDELLRRQDQERAAIMRWEERMTDSGGDDTETLHQFALDGDGASTTGDPTRESSRAASPDFYSDDSQCLLTEAATSSEHPSSPLSVASNWDLVDDFSSYDEMESDAGL